MKVVFDRSFYKSLDKISDPSLREKIADVIIKTESAKSLREITNLKKLQGFRNFYRIRVGDYRIGIELEPHQVIRFIVVVNRRDIYRYFP